MSAAARSRRGSMASPTSWWRRARASATSTPAVGALELDRASRAGHPGRAASSPSGASTPMAVPDLVARARSVRRPRFSLLLSQVSGGQVTYQERAFPVTPLGRPCDVNTGELNGDGKADLVLLGEGRTRDVRSLPLVRPHHHAPWRRRRGLRAEQRCAPSAVRGVGPDRAGPVGVEIVDLDGNGLGEVVLTEGDSATVIYMNHTVVVRPAAATARPAPAPPPGCRPRADLHRAEGEGEGRRQALEHPQAARRLRPLQRALHATVSVQLLFSKRGRSCVRSRFARARWPSGRPARKGQVPAAPAGEPRRPDPGRTARQRPSLGPSRGPQRQPQEGDKEDSAGALNRDRGIHVEDPRPQERCPTPSTPPNRADVEAVPTAPDPSRLMARRGDRGCLEPEQVRLLPKGWGINGAACESPHCY